MMKLLTMDEVLFDPSAKIALDPKLSEPDFLSRDKKPLTKAQKESWDPTDPHKDPTIEVHEVGEEVESAHADEAAEELCEFPENSVNEAFQVMDETTKDYEVCIKRCSSGC